MTALISGGSRGIGFAIARALSAAGHRLALLARDPDRLRAAAEELGPDTVWRAADTCDPAATRAAVAELCDALGWVDVLVPAAGGGVGSLTTTPFRDALRIWDEQLGTNLRGAFVTIQTAAPHLRRPGGRIITISSIAAYTGGSRPGSAIYAAAKAGLLGLTRGLARELTPEGITVNAIVPGYIATDFHGPDPQARMDATVPQIPAGRIGEPDDVAGAAAFLASPSASYVSGQVLHVNGGWYLGG